MKTLFAAFFVAFSVSSAFALSSVEVKLTYDAGAEQFLVHKAGDELKSPYYVQPMTEAVADTLEGLKGASRDCQVRGTYFRARGVTTFNVYQISCN